VCQSPPLLDSFTTLALSFDPKERLTTGFLGFQAIKGYATPGVLLLEGIRDAATQIHDPMLIPTLMYDAWLKVLQHEQEKINSRLREVQEQTGLMSDYLRRQSLAQDSADYSAVHQTLIQQHAYLTNGMADFLSVFAPSLTRYVDKLEQHLRKVASPFPYDSFHIRQHLEDLHIRADADLQHRQRMLDRIGMYLQVLYNLMQQQVARETKRDSSAMKSIALLTMVFLPATAIATVMAPFIKITDDNEMLVTNHFWIFWAIAGPVTFLVVVLWVLWIRRSDLPRLLGATQRPWSKLD
jgi:hypothetical protein